MCPRRCWSEECPFGGLLRLVEQMERFEVDEALDEIRALQMTSEQVLEAPLHAFAWRSPEPSRSSL